MAGHEAAERGDQVKIGGGGDALQHGAGGELGRRVHVHADHGVPALGEQSGHGGAAGPPTPVTRMRAISDHPHLVGEETHGLETLGAGHLGLAAAEGHDALHHVRSHVRLTSLVAVREH